MTGCFCSSVLKTLPPRDLSLLFCKTSAESSVGRKRCHPVAFSGNRSGAWTQQLLGTARQGFFSLPYIWVSFWCIARFYMNLGEKRRICISVYVDSVNYQLVILAPVSTCLALCCSHPCTVLVEWLGRPFSDSDWEFGHFSTPSACQCGSSQVQPLRQMCWFRCSRADLRSREKYMEMGLEKDLCEQHCCLVLLPHQGATEMLTQCLWKTK